MSTRRLFIFTIIAVFLVCLIAPAALAASGDDVGRYFSDEYLVKARKYSLTGWLIFALFVIVQVAFLIAAVFPLGRFLKRVSTLIGRRLVPSALIFTTLLIFLYFLVLTPVSLLGYWRGKAWGFCTMDIGAWFMLRLKGMAVMAVMTVPLAAALMWAIRRWPKGWWLPAWVVSSVLSVAMAFLFPLIVAPLYFEFEPLDDGELRTGTLALANKAGIEVGEVLVSDASRYSTHTNAYFSGIGPTKQIVLYDTLIERNTTPEVLSVVAHEMGHWKHDHILKGTILLIVVSFFGFFVLAFVYRKIARRRPFNLASQADVRGLPLLALLIFVGGYAVMPFSNMVSRYFERQADACSLELTGDADAFISAQVRLTTHNLSDPDPPRALHWFFGTHPAGIERILAAEKSALPQRHREHRAE
jgi:STE24 endopeptidase